MYYTHTLRARPIELFLLVPNVNVNQVLIEQHTTFDFYILSPA